VFSGNTISNNGVGLNFRSSSNNVFSGNTISNNDAGVNLFASSNNIFYHNNFLNPIQVSSDSENIWSQNSEGNYWSSYKGLDLNSNGIGDPPYQIDAHNIDNYPLMGAFYDFNVVSGNMTYEVSVICNSTVSGFRYEIGQQTGNKIIHFDVNDENVTAGFCRLMIPTELMNLPYIVLDSEGEITPTSLSASNETNAYLYFTYLGNSQTITVISSKALQLYQELSKELSDNQTALLADLDYLNAIYYGLLNNYTILLDHFNQLQNSYLSLNSSYQEHLSSYSENIQDVQNLVYIFAATTMVFLVTTVYLSRRAHASFRQKASNV
jgi:parallel beta-helix repeat protein